MPSFCPALTTAPFNASTSVGRPSSMCCSIDVEFDLAKSLNCRRRILFRQRYSIRLHDSERLCDDVRLQLISGWCAGDFSHSQAGNCANRIDGTIVDPLFPDMGRDIINRNRTEVAILENPNKI